MRYSALLSVFLELQGGLGCMYRIHVFAVAKPLLPKGRGTIKEFYTQTERIL